LFWNLLRWLSFWGSSPLTPVKRRNKVGRNSEEAERLESKASGNQSLRPFLARATSHLLQSPLRFAVNEKNLEGGAPRRFYLIGLRPLLCEAARRKKCAKRRAKITSITCLRQCP
jgi:hypothetical protein